MKCRASWIERRLKEYEAIFWSHVYPEPNSGCWLWAATTCKDGYGQVTLFQSGAKSPKATLRAHRVAAFYGWGFAFDDRLICHKCDVPAYCNPDHLYAGTESDNWADAVRRGRRAGERNGAAVLTTEQALEIAHSPLSQRVLMERYDVGQATISDIKSGATWGRFTGIQHRKTGRWPSSSSKPAQTP